MQARTKLPQTNLTDDRDVNIEICVCLKNRLVRLISVRSVAINVVKEEMF